MCKIRTLNQAIIELKEKDKNCCLTLSALRRMIRNNEIPYFKSGVKYLIDLNSLPNSLFINNEERNEDYETKGTKKVCQFKQ